MKQGVPGICITTGIILVRLAWTPAYAQIRSPKLPPSSAPTTAPAPSELVPQESTVFQLRVKWTRKWASKTDPKLSKKYEEYLLVARDVPRGSAFEALLTQIQDTSDSYTISGEHCLDMLGSPDFWIGAPNGRAELVYQFRGFSKKAMEVVLEIDANDKVVGIGWNRVGINDYNKLGYNH